MQQARAIVLRIPWAKRPPKAAREIIAPSGATPRLDNRPIRAETRAKLVAAIAQGRRWLDEIVTGNVTSVEQIAEPRAVQRPTSEPRNHSVVPVSEASRGCNRGTIATRDWRRDDPSPSGRMVEAARRPWPEALNFGSQDHHAARPRDRTKIIIGQRPNAKNRTLQSLPFKLADNGSKEAAPSRHLSQSPHVHVVRESAWWWTQSDANGSRLLNSLFTGKIQGKLTDFGPPPQSWAGLTPKFNGLQENSLAAEAGK